MRPRQWSVMLAALPRTLFGALASDVVRSARASRSSLTTARKKAATTDRAAFSGSGGRRATSADEGSAASTAGGSSGLGSTTTPSGRRGPSGNSAAVANDGPWRPGSRDAHAARTRDATTTALRWLDGRIIRAGDGHDRMGRHHRPPARLLVEIRRDEAEMARGHVGNADAAQRVVAEEPLEIGAALDDLVRHRGAVV